MHAQYRNPGETARYRMMAVPKIHGPVDVEGVHTPPSHTLNERRPIGTTTAGRPDST